MLTTPDALEAWGMFLLILGCAAFWAGGASWLTYETACTASRALRGAWRRLTGPKGPIAQGDPEAPAVDDSRALREDGAASRADALAELQREAGEGDPVEFALAFAVAAHDGRRREKSGAPYVAHALDVARMLGQWGVARDDHPDLWTAALLHDVVEDSPVSIEDLARVFNPTVAGWVEDLTHATLVGATRGERKADADEYMASFRDKPIEALVVKVADRICNVRDFRVESPNYGPRYAMQAGKLFSALVERIGEIEERFGASTVWKLTETVIDALDGASRSSRSPDQLYAVIEALIEARRDLVDETVAQVAD